MDHKLKLPCNTKIKEEVYVIDSDNIILGKYRLMASARNDLNKLKNIWGYDLRIITKEDYEESKSVTTK